MLPEAISLELLYVSTLLLPYSGSCPGYRINKYCKGHICRVLSLVFIHLTKEGLETFEYLKICSLLAQTIIIRDKILALSVIKLPLQDHFLSRFMLPFYSGLLFSVDVCKERWQQYFLKFNLVSNGICKIYLATAGPDYQVPWRQNSDNSRKWMRCHWNAQQVMKSWAQAMEQLQTGCQG